MPATFERSSISITAATAMLDAAMTRAAEIGIGVAVTIVDDSGVPKAFARMDDAPLMAVDVSRRKAITAVGLGLPTGKAWHEFIRDDPILSQGVQGIEDFTLLGGGLPIAVDGAPVGAIGVSGGHYEQDEDCARAALDTLG